MALRSSCKLLGLRGPAVSCGKVAALLRQSCGELPHQLAGRAAPGGGGGTMRDLVAFRQALRERLRATGFTQQQLARAIGLHPHVLSHKLHERDAAALTTPEVVSIVVTLAGWGGVGSKADALALLALMGLPREAIPAESWAAKPLARLPERPPPGSPPRRAGAAARPQRAGPATRRAYCCLQRRGNARWLRQLGRCRSGAGGEGAPASRPAHKCALLSAGSKPRRLWRACSARKRCGC